MRKFYSFIATLMLLVVGSGNAWADSWSINFKGLVSSNADVVISSTETVTIGGTELGTISYNDVAVDSKFVIQTGTKWLMRSDGLYQFNSGGRSFGLKDCTAGQIITITASGDPAVTANATLKSSSNGTYVYTVTADGGVKFTPARYLYFYTIDVEDPAADNVSYTVKFVDANGNSIKDDATYDDAPGATIAVSDGDKANIEFEGVTYIYDSDDAEGQTVAEDGSTVITVKFRVGEIWSYSVNEVCGEAVARNTSGEAVENTTIKMPYRRYNVVDGVLYEKGVTNKEYNHYFTLAEDGTEVNLAYTATETTDVVFLSEGEDIPGLSRCNSSNTGIRSSNSASAYAANGKVKITTLAPGTYKIVAGIYDASSNHDSHWIFLAGEEQVADLNCTAVNLQELSSEEFTLEKETAIYLGQGGANNRGLDYVYITGNGGTVDVESIEVTIGAAKYATLYYGDTNLEVPAGVTATTYTIAEDNVTLVESKVYTVGNVIPASEAVVLQGAANTYSFDIVATEATPDANNLLIGTDELTTFEEDGYKFYMLSNGIYGIGFYLQNESGNSIANDEHKAFLRVAEATASKAFFSLGGEATAINSVATAKKETKGVFDLQGRRVDNPVKGLYIMNGKKVVIK